MKTHDRRSFGESFCHACDKDVEATRVADDGWICTQCKSRVDDPNQRICPLCREWATPVFNEGDEPDEFDASDDDGWAQHCNDYGRCPKCRLTGSEADKACREAQEAEAKIDRRDEQIAELHREREARTAMETILEKSGGRRVRRVLRDYILHDYRNRLAENLGNPAVRFLTGLVDFGYGKRMKALWQEVREHVTDVAGVEREIVETRREWDHSSWNVTRFRQQLESWVAAFAKGRRDAYLGQGELRTSSDGSILVWLAWLDALDEFEVLARKSRPW
ncbi:MAG TPA: hypothetical protein VFZ65_22300 [Planctomycetota bacterium]|nr:hypothetical protein [Planctomycetota bacterium]